MLGLNGGSNMEDDSVLLPHGIKLCPSPNHAVFGYGDHSSTKRCLDWLEKNITSGCTVADIGGGTGILAIKAYLLGAGSVTCYEADNIARSLVEKNVEANGVDITIAGSFPEEWSGKKFDLLVANLGAGGLAYTWDDYAGKWYDDHRAEEEKPKMQTIQVPANAVVEQGPDGSLIIRSGV